MWYVARLRSPIPKENAKWSSSCHEKAFKISGIVVFEKESVEKTQFLKSR